MKVMLTAIVAIGLMAAAPAPAAISKADQWGKDYTLALPRSWDRDFTLPLPYAEPEQSRIALP